MMLAERKGGGVGQLVCAQKGNSLGLDTAHCDPSQQQGSTFAIALAESVLAAGICTLLDIALF